MKELKFRAYSKSRNRYLGKGDTLIYRHEVGLDGSRWWASLVERQDHSDEDIIVEQYTGLKDIDGKEIYEGDIVQCGAFVGQIKWLDGLGCWGAGDTVLYSFLKIKGITLPTSKIIGNIHENPELLGGKE